jgi:hypothetical protein
MLVQPPAVMVCTIAPPSGSAQWLSCGPTTDPPVAPEHVPGDSMAAVLPSGAVYSVVLGPKLGPLLLLLHAAATTAANTAVPAVKT